jgi:hypothetical protein
MTFHISHNIHHSLKIENFISISIAVDSVPANMLHPSDLAAPARLATAGGLG